MNKQQQQNPQSGPSHPGGQIPSNEDQQGVDKAPGEEQGRGEKVTEKDLKGKKVDRDITDPKDAPA